MKRFELAGKRKANEQVFLMSEHRCYNQNRPIFHKNDYHTIVKIPDNIFKTHFRYKHSNGIYENLTKITWKELDKVANIEVYSFLDHDYIQDKFK